MTISPEHWSDPDPLNWVTSQPDASCSVCGQRPDAVWVDHSRIWICRTCAVETLPALIADAIGADRDAGRPMAHYEAALPALVGKYWQAVASRLASRLRPGRERERMRKPKRSTRPPEPRRPVVPGNPSEN
jgi:hypothetical protein